MATTAIAKVAGSDEETKGALECLFDLERSGGITPVGLTLTDPSMPLETYLAIGRLFGQISRTINWLIGDWIIAGEELYPEDERAQAYDDIQSRYKEAERVTGIDHQVMLNVASVCRNVKQPQRCEPLGFWIHAEVSKFPPKEQKKWLKAAVKGSWTRVDLRRAIRADETGEDPDGQPESNHNTDGLTQCERIEAAVKSMLAVSERAEGGVFIPIDAYVRLEEAVSE